jgi:hypothetical protein
MECDGKITVVANLMELFQHPVGETEENYRKENLNFILLRIPLCEVYLTLYVTLP